MIMMNNMADIVGSMIMLAITTDMDTTDQADSTAMITSTVHHKP